MSWRRAALALVLGSGVAVALWLVAEGVARFAEHRAADRIAAARRLPPKPDGSFRIVALGGSTVAGTPVPEIGFVAQLERALRRLAPSRAFEVFNLGENAMASGFVRDRLAEVLHDAPDLAIILIGHNEFLDRSGEEPGDRFRTRVLGSSALARALAGLGDRLRGGSLEPYYAFPERLRPYDRSRPWFERKHEAFEENLQAIVALTRAAGVPLILCTAPSNLAEWAPVHRDIAWASSNPNYDADVDRVQSLLRAGRAAEAERSASEIVTANGDDAMFLYLKARALERLSRIPEARELYERARDLDAYPWRASRRLNDAVRGLAGEGVRVVDLVRAFEAFAANGLVGFELFADNLHPSPLGGALVAVELVRAMSEEGHLLAPATELGDPRAWLDEYERQLGDPRRRARLELEWLMRNAVYSMKTPFYAFEVARRHLEEAQRLAPRDWQVVANLGALALLEGRVEEGRRQLARARRLKGSSLDPDDRSTVPYLKEALAHSRAGAGAP